MVKLLLIDSRVDSQPFIDSRKADVNYLTFDYVKDNFNSLLNKATQNTYDQIGLVQHSNFTTGFNILQKEKVGSNNDVHPYKSFDSILEFFRGLNKAGVTTFDFLGCELFDPVKTPAIFSYLEEKSGLDLRASSNLTGSNGGDWIMESDNINIMDTYFTEQINNYTGVLGDDSYNIRMQNYVTKFDWDAQNNKLTGKRIEWLNKDVNGKPLDPTYNIDGSQKLNTPGYTMISWGGLTEEPSDSVNIWDGFFRGEPAVTLSDITAISEDADTLEPTVIPSDINESDVVSIYSTYYAIAALKSDGTVVAWGPGPGPRSAPKKTLLSDFGGVVPAEIASGLKLSDFGGVVPTEIASGLQLDATYSKVVSIYSTIGAFAALREDGTVVAWGDDACGGTTPTEIASGSQSSATYSKVVSIYSTSGAFAALREDGTVVAVGKVEEMRRNAATVLVDNSSSNSDAITYASIKADPRPSPKISSIHPFTYGFVLLAEDNKRYVYVDSYKARDSLINDNQFKLTNVVSVLGVENNSSQTIAVVLKSDGSVGVISIDFLGYFITKPLFINSTKNSKLTDVVSIYSNDFEFAALKSDGSVITFNFGTLYSGGEFKLPVRSAQDTFVSNLDVWTSNLDLYNLIPSELTDVVSIYSTSGAFVALKKDGSIVTWGVEKQGSIIPEDINTKLSKDFKVIAIYNTTGTDNTYGANFSALIKNVTTTQTIFTVAAAGNPAQLAVVLATANQKLGLSNTTGAVLATNYATAINNEIEADTGINDVNQRSKISGF